MTGHFEKSQLLDNIRQGYAAFEAILVPLTPHQMITSGVNGKWSVKDNLAHISTWHHFIYSRIQAIKTGTEEPAVSEWQNLGEDELNERTYQQNKDRELDDVLKEFRATYQHVLESVEQASQEELDQPVAPQSRWSLADSVVGNTYDHYQEHGRIIKDWFAGSGE